jgi:hypothetical protein
MLCQIGQRQELNLQLLEHEPNELTHCSSLAWVIFQVKCREL